MRDTEKEREAETQAEGEAGFIAGSLTWDSTGVSRITLWAEGGTKPLSHPGCPVFAFFAIKFSGQDLVLCRFQSVVTRCDSVA